MERMNDLYWSNAKQFVETHKQHGDQVIAPAQFASGLSDVATCTYEMSYVKSIEAFQWIVLHKGMLRKVRHHFLYQTVQHRQPVYANEVFVIFSNSVPNVTPLASANPDANPDASLASVQPPIEPQYLQELLDEIAPREHWDKLTSEKTSRHSGWKQRLDTLLDQNFDTQVSQLNATLNCLDRLDRNTTQLEQNRQGTQDLRKIVQQLKGEVRDLRQTVQNLCHTVQNLPEKQPSNKGLQRIDQQSPYEFQLACREACQTTYLGEETLLCRVLGKHLLYADSQDVAIVPHFCMNGFWETWMTLAVARVLQPGWYCVDVGANHGYYTLLMADAIGQAGRIIALEPNPKLADLLQKTVDVNGFANFTTVVMKAAVDQPGEPLNLVIPKGRGMNGSLSQYVSPTDEVVVVETTSIDALVQDWERVDFIKIDAEGAEETIWWGMQQTLERHPQVLIVLEFNDGRYPDPKTFLERIVKTGFELRHIDFDAEVKPLTIEQCLTERPHKDWLLFLQK